MDACTLIALKLRQVAREDGFDEVVIYKIKFKIDNSAYCLAYTVTCNQKYAFEIFLFRYFSECIPKVFTFGRNHFHSPLKYFLGFILH